MPRVENGDRPVQQRQRRQMTADTIAQRIQVWHDKRWRSVFDLGRRDDGWCAAGWRHRHVRTGTFLGTTILPASGKATRMAP